MPNARWRSWTAWASAIHVCDQGVSWNVGRTFLRNDEVYQLQPGARRPATNVPGMINLQQYHLEEA
jgi:3-(3-hydroxy-phenyl)propionate hydroxylase